MGTFFSGTPKFKANKVLEFLNKIFEILLKFSFTIKHSAQQIFYTSQFLPSRECSRIMTKELGLTKNEFAFYKRK